MRGNSRANRKTEMLGALLGVVGMVSAAVQAAAAKRAEGERRAKDKFLEWDRLGFEHPAFANPDLAEQVHGKSIPDDKVLYEQYQWFVAYFLNTAEEIWRIAHGRRGWAPWKAVLEDQIGFHAAYLKGPWRANGYDQHYTRGFRAFIDSVLESDRTRAWPKSAGK